jgi:hypothetical protein
MTWYRKRAPAPQHADPRVRILVMLLNRRSEPSAVAFERAGLNQSSLRDWRRGRAPRVSNLEAALNAIGYELCIRHRETRAVVELPSNAMVQS